MRIRKTLIAVLLTAIIAAIMAFPVSASTVYFTSVNNTLRSLSDDTMPIDHNGVIYIPYSVFNSTDLKTYAVYSTSAKAVTVIGNGVQLIYNLKNGTTYDKIGVKYKYHALYLNGRVYLPAEFTATLLGINYSVITGNEYGVIIRLTVGEVLDDATFSRSASFLMKSRLDDYNKTKESSEPSVTPTAVTPSAQVQTPAPSSSISPSPTPAQTPVPTPAASSVPTPTASPEPDFSDIEIYLSFSGIDADNTHDIIKALSDYSYSACFFVSEADITNYPDIVRSILFSGNTIGLICDDSSTAGYLSASQLLYEAARTSSFIYISACDSSESTGYDELIRYSSVTEFRSLSLSADRLMLSAADKRADFYFTSDDNTAETLRIFLKTLKTGKYNVSALTEYKASING